MIGHSAVMRLVLIFLALTACVADSASLSMRKAAKTTVTVGGDTFRVFYFPEGGPVEVHRVNVAFPPPSRVMTFQHAYVAIVRATGCAVEKDTLSGDHAIQRAKIVC